MKKKRKFPLHRREGIAGVHLVSRKIALKSDFKTLISIFWEGKKEKEKPRTVQGKRKVSLWSKEEKRKHCQHRLEPLSQSPPGPFFPGGPAKRREGGRYNWPRIRKGMPEMKNNQFLHRIIDRKKKRGGGISFQLVGVAFDQASPSLRGKFPFCPNRRDASNTGP